MRKPRSTFWVVSTHLLTVWFVYSWLFGGLLSIAILFLWYFLFESFAAPLVLYAVVMSCFALGSICGLFASLSYIGKTALHPDFTRCTKPAILTYLVLQISPLTYHVVRALQTSRSSEELTLLAVMSTELFWTAMVALWPLLIIHAIYYAVTVSAFVHITRYGFQHLNVESESGQAM